MKKYCLGFTIFFILACLLLVSCSSGVSQEQYNKATGDLAAAQAQVQSLQNQIQTLQSQIQASQGDKTALTDLQNKISQIKSYWDLFTAFYQIAIGGQTPSATEILGIMGKIQAMGDTTLSTKMQAVISANGGEQQSIDLVNYIIGKISDLLK